jgi:hypothetical protein
MLCFRYTIVNTLHTGDKYNNNNNNNNNNNYNKEQSSVWVEHSQGPLDFRSVRP